MLNKKIRKHNELMLSQLNYQNKNNNLFIYDTIKDIIKIKKFGRIPNYTNNWEEEDEEREGI